MKNKWKWIYNPFEFIAGWKAFGIGILILCVTTVIGYFGSMVFYGIQAKAVPHITWNMAFSLQFLGLAVTVLIMYITALIFAKHVRFQDILGTITLAKYPLLFIAVISLVFGNTLSSVDINKFISQDFTIFDIAPLLLFGIISIIFIVWNIALLYNAFRVSSNLKGVKCAVLFTAALFLSEIIILVLVYLYSK